MTNQSLEMLKNYYADAGNWNGYALLGGNVKFTKEDRGNLTDLKKAGLVTTFEDEGLIWMEFTEAGEALAKSLLKGGTL